MAKQPIPASLNTARLFCITNERMQTTNQALSVACNTFGIEAVMVSLEHNLALPDTIPVQGDFLYRAISCTASRRLERDLWHPGIVAFYDDPFLECCSHEIGYRHQHEAESLANLLTPLQCVGSSPFLENNPERFKAYRLIFVGHRLVAAGKRIKTNIHARTGCSGSCVFAQFDPPSEVIDIALRTMQVAHFEFFAVDVFEDQNEKLTLAGLEFPYDFLDLQHCSHINIADAMLGYLVRKRCIGTTKHLGLNRTRRRLDPVQQQPSGSI